MKAHQHAPTIDIWDKHYPIMTTEDPKTKQVTHYVYINDAIEAPYEFTEIIALLDTAQEDELVVIKLNSPGGYLNTTLMLIDAIKACEATVVCELSGEVASAATMIALACVDIYIAPHTTFMIHNFSGGTFGKGHEIASNVEFMLETNKLFFFDIYKHFLSKKEIQEVINGRDIYCTTDQVYERFDNVKAKRAARQEKAQEEAEKEQQQMLVTVLESLGYSVEKR